MASARGNLLCRADFPLYTIRALDDHNFLVAGGGGQVKTGIANAIEIYELKYVNKQYVAGSTCRHDTGTQAIMNSHSVYDGRHHTLAAGMDDECHVYSVKYSVVSQHNKHSSNQNHTENIRRRVPKNDSDNQNEGSDDNMTKSVTFAIEEVSKTKTDFSSDGSFQKVVRFSWDHNYVATGGADGHLRLWKLRGMKKIHDIAAHDCDIDDLDFSPDNKQVVSIGRDGTANVWNVKDGKRHTALSWSATQWEPYRCRACRFGAVEGKDHYNLFTINIPSKRRTKSSQCYLSKWNGKDYKLEKWARTGTEILSALAVSADGTYLGVGTISGSVAIYISFSLQKVYNIREIHDIFVTGLDFIPPSKQTSFSLHNNIDCTLLSISADNTVRMHQVSSRDSYSVVWVVVGVVILVFLFFWLLSEMSL